MAVRVMKKNYHWTVSLQYALILLLLIFSWQAEAIERIGVVYPQVREPFSRVYADILDGIRKEYHGEIYELPVNGGLLNIQDLSSKPHLLPDAYIVLGSKSLEAASNLNKPLFAAVTEASTSKKLIGTIVLKPSADVYLSNLLRLYPKTSTVHVVYSPSVHQKLIADADRFLKVRNKNLNAITAKDIRESARALRQIAESAKQGDAIWLLSDSGLIDAASLDAVLDSAWDKKLAVFSSNPAFTKRGALFAIYPDNIGIGKSLATLVENVMEKKLPEGSVEFLKDVKIAYNERTGNHIGINLTNDMRSSIDLILPEY